MKRILIGLLLTLFAGGRVLAITYYVSNAGSNSNNGLTPGTAFLTLQYAADRVAAGDSVVILPGTYTGFYQTTSGSPQQPIVFAAQEGVLINTKNYKTNDGINLEGASYIILEGFNVRGMPRAGIRAVLDTGVVIRNNVCDSNKVWGILTGFSENIVIEHNECIRSVEQHGIYFGNSADHPVIRNNICWGNSDCGIHINSDINTQPDEGVADGIISGALVEGNIIYNNGVGGGSGINCDGVQNSRIQNNLLYNNHASGISLYRIDGAEGAKNNVIVNNTILQPADGRWALNISDASTGNTVFNNILYSAHSFRGSISIDNASLPEFNSNHNVLVNRLSSDGGNSNMAFAQWQQATLSDSNSVTSTPLALFADAAMNDYHLAINSPARDLGRMNYNLTTAPVVDIETHTRPQGAYPDAGAYEYEVVVTHVPEVSENEVGIYPNPANGILNIDVVNFVPEYIGIFDANGRKVKDLLFIPTLDISSLVTGIYYLVVYSNENAAKRRFVKL